jgi:hypothetical protein
MTLYVQWNGTALMDDTSPVPIYRGPLPSSIAALEDDCAERYPGDEHRTATTPRPSLKAIYSGAEVLITHTDWAGHKSVVIYSPDAAQDFIEQLIEAQACAEAHLHLRAQQRAKDYGASLAGQVLP